MTTSAAHSGHHRPRTRGRRRLASGVIALAAAIALAAGGCASRGSGPGTPPSGTSRYPTIPAACVVGGLAARCRYVWVPEDWAHPRGPRIPLKVVVLPASAARAAPDPLFFLAGWGGRATGFGDSAENGFAWATQAFAGLNRARDLVFVEQRGTPGSAFQACPGLPPMTALNPAADRAWVRRCLAAARRDPRHDTTIAAARDLDQVRNALGYNKISLFGVSYGVTLGLAYLQRFSAHVRTAVFDSGSLLNVRLEQLGEAHTRQAFGQIARDCATDPACARAYHPAADMAAVLAHLRAHPARVSLPRPGYTTARPQRLTITVPVFLGLVQNQYLSTSLNSVWLPADLHAMARGRWQQVIGKREFTTDILPAPAPVSMQDITIECGDTWAAISPAAARRQAGSLFAPVFTPAAAGAIQALCAAWPHDPGASGTVRSSVPVVFLNGTADPSDPPANVAAAPRTMPRALLVSVPGAGHFVLNWTLNPGCLLTRTTAFIQSGRPGSRAAWERCARTVAPFASPGS